MKRKFISAAVASTMLVSAVASAGSSALEELRAINLMSGFEDGTLREDEKVTRAQAASIIMRSVGFDDAKWFKSTVKSFDDVPISHWASGYIYKAVSEGVIDGVSEMEYCPDDEVTYEQAVKMIVELLGYTALSYPDGYIQKATELGLLKDISADMGEKLTREKFAALVCNALDCRLNAEDGEGIITLREKFQEDGGGKTTVNRDESEYEYSEEMPKGTDVSYDAPISESLAGGSSGGGAAMSSSKSYAASVFDSSAYRPYMPMPRPDYQEQISAGQLTAGRWSDTDNWDFWKNLMNNNKFLEMQQKWEIPTDKYEILVTDGNTPVCDYGVKLKNANDEVIWTSVTDKDGKAFVFLNDAQEQGVKISVEGKGTKADFENIQLSHDKPVLIECQSEKPEDILDLMFTIDTTGSMSDELRYIKEELKDVVIKLDTNVRVSCNYYRDFGDIYTVKPFDFSTNIDKVISQISKQYASGGGDYEEAVDLALLNAVNEHDWSESARSRLLFLVLDAPPHFTQEVVANIKAAVTAASEKGIHIIPVASSGVDKNTEFFLRSIAIATNGTYIFLTDDSGIGNSHLEPTIGDYQVEYLNELILNVIKEYIGQQ